MKYLKVYESFSDNVEFDLFNYVLQCIENSYPNKVDLNELIKQATKDEQQLNKESWIRIVIGCLSDDDKKQIGSLFINSYIKGNKNKYLFAFLYKKLKEIDEKIATSIHTAFNL